MRKIRALRAANRKCKLHIEGGVNRPPLERSPAVVALFQQAEKVAKQLGFSVSVYLEAGECPDRTPSTIVDVSPFSTNGALVLASATERDRQALFRKLLLYGAVITVIAPPILWAIWLALS